MDPQVADFAIIHQIHQHHGSPWVYICFHCHQMITQQQPKGLSLGVMGNPPRITIFQPPHAWKRPSPHWWGSIHPPPTPGPGKMFGIMKSPVVWGKQSRPFPHQNSNQCIHLEVATSTLTQPLWHPPPKHIPPHTSKVCVCVCVGGEGLDAIHAHAIQPVIHRESKRSRNKLSFWIL